MGVEYGGWGYLTGSNLLLSYNQRERSHGKSQAWLAYEASERRYHAEMDRLAAEDCERRAIDVYVEQFGGQVRRAWQWRAWEWMKRQF